MAKNEANTAKITIILVGSEITSKDSMKPFKPFRTEASNELAILGKSCNNFPCVGQPVALG